MEKTPLDLYRLGSSRDFGVSYRGQAAGGKVSYFPSDFYGWDAPDVRWVAPESMHLTLKFLGDVENTEIHRVCQLAAEAVAGLDALHGAGDIEDISAALLRLGDQPQRVAAERMIRK